MKTYLVDQRWLRYSNGQWMVVESVKRRWKVARGDTLVFYTKGFRGVQFTSVARVGWVETARFEHEEENQTSAFFEHTVYLSEPNRLPDDRTLDDLMFSLRRVFNFTRPHLHIRHRSQLSDEDLRTVLTGAIHTKRSLYFGLLRHLPETWRRYHEYQSLALASHTSVSTDMEESPPTDELLSLLEETAFQSVALAASIHDLSSKIGVPGVSRIVATTDDESIQPWSAERLLRDSSRLLDDIDTGRELLPRFHEGPWSSKADTVELPSLPPLPPGVSLDQENQRTGQRRSEDAALRLPVEKRRSEWRPHRW